MEQILGQMELNGMFKVSITESTMMRILQCAIDKAHEKLKSKKGVLERLNGISKFYELAVMQLDGCLKFVQQETGDNYVLESNHKQILMDLAEIRDRLHGRLKEAELAISDKDRELMERLSNEWKLRQALELKERELASLRANLEIEKTKSEEIEEFVLSNHVTGDADREEEFCELKNSVDQQVWNIKQQLEPDYELVDQEGTQGIDNKKVEQMGSDINILKETLDLAFGKMHGAIFSSELGSIEHQWRWDIERCINAVVINDSLKDFQENFEKEVKKRERQASVGLNKRLSDLMKEMACLQQELELVSYHDEVQLNSISGSKTSTTSPQTGIQCEDSLQAKGKSLSEGDSKFNSNSFSLKNQEVGSMKQPPGEDSEEDGGHYVAKMIKSHESIIRRKSEELCLQKREILQEKVCPSSRKEKGFFSMKRRIQELIMRLEDLRKWTSRLGNSSDDCQHDGREKDHPKRLFTAYVTHREKPATESFEEIWAKLNKSSVSAAMNKEPCDEIKILKQEMEDANLQTMMMEETYLTLFKSLVAEFYNVLLNHTLESLIKEDMYESFIKEMNSEWNEIIESNRIEVETREEILYTIWREATEEFGSSLDCTLVDCQDASHESNCLEGSTRLSSLEDMLREDIERVIFHETYRELKEAVESYKSESLFREKINWIVLDETINDIIGTANCTLSRLQESQAADNLKYNLQLNNMYFASAEMSVNDDVLKVLLGEMVKEWKMKIDDFKIESLFSEEIHQFVVVEAVKEALINFGEIEVENENRISENLLCTDKMHGIAEDNETKNKNQTIDALFEFSEGKEAAILSASSEIKGQTAHLDLVGSKFQELDEHRIHPGSFTEEKNISDLVKIKLKNALQQFVLCKSISSDSGCRGGIAFSNEERHNKMIPNFLTERHREFCNCQSEDIKEGKIITFESFLTPLQELSEALKDFERTSYDRLEMNNLRLEKMKHKLDLLVEQAASLSHRESLYKKAFIRRCENLQKAETEVDLLGDQVDVLTGLLDKVYKMLHQHSPKLQQYFEVGEILKLIRKTVEGINVRSK